MKKQRKTTRRELFAFGAAVGGGAAITTGASLGSDQGPSAARATGLPTLDETDVLVVGGGTAGIGAALGAARQGVKTLLIENHSFFGGVAAWALGMAMNQMRPAGKPRSAVHELLIAKLQAYGDQAVRLGKHEVWSNVEYLKVAILDALDAVGCRYLVHLRAADAIVEKNRIAGVIVATKRGLMAIRAKAVVDCTGDGDVAYFAGAETMIDPNGLMPMTLSLALTNIDAQLRHGDVNQALQKSRAKYALIPAGIVEVNQIAHSHSWYINHGGTAAMGRIDATDPADRSRAECASRRQALQMAQALRESEKPEVQQIEWLASGPQVSVRETRRIKGAYVVTEEDALAGRTFEDTIAWRSGYLDPGGLRGAKFAKMKIHDVPYRCIVAEKLDGLLMGGRCISATHVGAMAGKSMGNCMATGHAAGVAAALCAKKGTMPRELNVRDIQEALQADGVDLDPKDRDQHAL